MYKQFRPGIKFFYRRLQDVRITLASYDKQTFLLRRIVYLSFYECLSGCRTRRSPSRFILEKDR